MTQRKEADLPMSKSTILASGQITPFDNLW
jgi:hypothetical protein